MARRFCRTRSGIQRIINEVRAARILELPLDYTDNRQFRRPGSQKIADEILDLPPGNDLATKKRRLQSGLSAYMVSLYEVPLLTREQERTCFSR